MPAQPSTIYFEQDGAFFAFRDRPFYQTAFDAMGDDGMSLRVCASFTCEAPFGVVDFDMAGAEKAAAWFVAECERAGFIAERAPSYDRQPEYPAHPECEAADLAATDDVDCGEMSIAQFAAMRRGEAAPTPDRDAIIADAIARIASGESPTEIAAFVLAQPTRVMVGLSHAIEDRAADGTPFAAVFDILCNGEASDALLQDAA